MPSRCARTVKKIDLDGTTVFADGIAAPADLVVVGTGNDVTPIVEAGKQADFRVTVAGFRGPNAAADREPQHLTERVKPYCNCSYSSRYSP
jgi:xanthine dehydrogenase accessory factor